MRRDEKNNTVLKTLERKISNPNLDLAVVEN